LLRSHFKFDAFREPPVHRFGPNMALEGKSIMPRSAHRSAPSLGDHKLLIAMAVLAVMYCVGAPLAANLIGQLGY
jgi:hypothetical protein